MLVEYDFFHFVVFPSINMIIIFTGLYHQAGCLRHWAAVRYVSSLLHHTVDSISPFITAVLVHGKQVSFYSHYMVLFVITGNTFLNKKHFK